MARKRKENLADLDAFNKEFGELCKKYEVHSGVAVMATSMRAADEGSLIGMAIVYQGMPMMHEGLLAWAFGYSSGHHLEKMDDMKAWGVKSFRENIR